MSINQVLKSLRAYLASAPASGMARPEERVEMYRNVAARAGHEFDCLQEAWGGTDSLALVTSTGEGAVECRIQGPLDDFWGVDVRRIIAEINDLSPQSLHVIIESPGGFVDDGLAMFSELWALRHSGVAVKTEARGVVASAAVMPFLAGEDRLISAGCRLMTHAAWTFLVMSGNAAELQETMKIVLKRLEVSDSIQAEVYAAAVGVPLKTAKAWIDGENWWDCAECESEGFATETVAASPSGGDEKARASALVGQLRAQRLVKALRS